MFSTINTYSLFSYTEKKQKMLFYRNILNSSPKTKLQEKQQNDDKDTKHQICKTKADDHKIRPSQSNMSVSLQVMLMTHRLSRSHRRIRI